MERALQKTIENRSVGGVVARPPVAVAAGRGPGAGRLLAFGATLTLVIAAFALMLWLTSDPVRREAVEGLVQSPFGLVVLFGLAAISTATLILPAPGLALTAIAGATGDPIVVGVVAGLGQAVGSDGLRRRLERQVLPARERSDLTDHRLVEATGRARDLRARGGSESGLRPGRRRGRRSTNAGRRYLAAAATGKVIKNVAIAGGASMIGGLMAAIMTNSLWPVPSGHRSNYTCKPRAGRMDADRIAVHARKDSRPRPPFRATAPEQLDWRAARQRPSSSRGDAL